MHKNANTFTLIALNFVQEQLTTNKILSKKNSRQIWRTFHLLSESRSERLSLNSAAGTCQWVRNSDHAKQKTQGRKGHSKCQNGQVNFCMKKTYVYNNWFKLRSRAIKILLMCFNIVLWSEYEFFYVLHIQLYIVHIPTVAIRVMNSYSVWQNSRTSYAMTID